MIHRIFFGFCFIAGILQLGVQPLFAQSIAVPDLFQATATPTQATAFFAPIPDMRSYQIFYGLNSAADQYSVQFDSDSQTGVLQFTLQNLPENTQMYIKVRGISGSQTSGWSNTLKIVTPTSGSTTFYEHPPSVQDSQVQNNKLVLGASTSIFDDPTVQSLKKTACEYVVKYGDTLWGIASSFLGNGNKYKQIVDKNKDVIPNAIKVGQMLNIGCY